MCKLHPQYYVLKDRQEQLLSRKNRKTDFYNGIYDRWEFPVLTREHGRITVKVRGARRRNNPLSASCQLLVLSEFTLFSYRDTYVVNDASVVELFQEKIQQK